MLGIKGIEAIEFGSGDVSLRDQGLDRPPEGGFVGDALLEAAARQDAELDFRHIQPTAVLGGRSSMDPSRDGGGVAGGIRPGVRPGTGPSRASTNKRRQHSHICALLA